MMPLSSNQSPTDNSAPRNTGGVLSPRPLRAPGTASPSLSLEDTSPPWSADAARPECGHCWRRPRDSEPPGHGAHPGPMYRAAENHSRNPSWPASLPWWSARETRPRRPRHPAAPPWAWSGIVSTVAAWGAPSVSRFLDSFLTLLGATLASADTFEARVRF